MNSKKKLTVFVGSLPMLFLQKLFPSQHLQHQAVRFDLSLVFHFILIVGPVKKNFPFEVITGFPL